MRDCQFVVHARAEICLACIDKDEHNLHHFRQGKENITHVPTTTTTPGVICSDLLARTKNHVLASFSIIE